MEVWLRLTIFITISTKYSLVQQRKKVKNMQIKNESKIFVLNQGIILGFNLKNSNNFFQKIENIRINSIIKRQQFKNYPYYQIRKKRKTFQKKFDGKKTILLKVFLFE